MKFAKRKTYKTFSKKKNPFKGFVLMMCFIFTVSASGYAFYKYSQYYANVPSMKSVYADWENKNYTQVYEKTSEILKRRPYDGEVLAMHGFASYYIFAEQTDYSIGYTYLDNAILHLRQAMYRILKSERPKIAYLLGKAYYQKGYYYSDLAVKYLDEAAAADIKFADLAEFRAMAASLLGNSEKAIESFTEALTENPSDLLLFALAQNYMKVGDIKNAKLYFFETIDNTKDTLLELKCRYLLGTIFLDEGIIEKAEKEFNTIIEKDITSADAYYGLGLIAELRGDLIKARSQWRKALKFDPLHNQTRIKLNLL